ncbi:carboxyltransferase domain-containing protein [Vibrio mytili]|uniref:5-oxoprolinase subunit B family protein n=1 Tax=Vibrio mytili TaxID=50718 RepID=UPI002F418199
MRQEHFCLSCVSECSVFVSFDEHICEEHIGELARMIRENLSTIVMNVIPSYRTILIDYLPFRITEKELLSTLNQIITLFDPKQSSHHPTKSIVIPVYYSEETALDLPRFKQRGLSLESLVDAHTRSIYTVSAIGFAPGFAFLSDVEDELSMPRLETPRTHVPAGSVGIADNKTAVYPTESPGGWNIIGRSPMHLFTDRPPFIPFNVGDNVTFLAISKQEFIDQGGKL